MDTVLPFLKKYWTLLIACLLLGFIIALTLSGFRIGPGPSFVRLGTLSVTNLPEGSTAYIDIVRALPLEDGTITASLMPGLHTIIIETPGNQPWSELFTVPSASSTSLHPILVPVSVKSERIAGADYAHANTQVWQTLLPSRSRPIIVANGCAEVYVSGNLIVANASSTHGTQCVPPAFLCDGDTCNATVVYETPDAPRSVLKHPTREDALIVASGGLLYLLELDPREPQFTAPLYKSAFVKAGLWDETSVVVSDGTSIFVIDITP